MGCEEAILWVIRPGCPPPGVGGNWVAADVAHQRQDRTKRKSSKCSSKLTTIAAVRVVLWRRTIRAGEVSKETKYGVKQATGWRTFAVVGLRRFRARRVATRPYWQPG